MKRHSGMRSFMAALKFIPWDKIYAHMVAHGYDTKRLLDWLRYRWAGITGHSTPDCEYPANPEAMEEMQRQRKWYRRFI